MTRSLSSRLALALHWRQERLFGSTPVSFITRWLVASLLLGSSLIVLLPATAEAQRRAAPRLVRPRPPIVVVHPVYRRPLYRHAFYRPFYGYQWGPYGYPYPPYGYGYGYRDALTTSVRLEISPRDAEVYVDGYFAGEVDDFDGIFQRLRLPPGGHEIVVYMDGYRTIRESLYLSSGADRTIRLTMTPLASGEVSEPPPAPAERGDAGTAGPDGRIAPGYGAPADQRPAPAEAPARFGTLSVRIQPADAEIFVDGERWSAPSGDDRMAVQLSEGRHRVEVRKAGFVTYAEDVLIRRGGTLTLNVSLTTGNAN